jgi:hypothetical protein
VVRFQDISRATGFWLAAIDEVIAMRGWPASPLPIAWCNSHFAAIQTDPNPEQHFAMFGDLKLKALRGFLRLIA